MERVCLSGPVLRSLRRVPADNSSRWRDSGVSVEEDILGDLEAL